LLRTRIEDRKFEDPDSNSEEVAEEKGAVSLTFKTFQDWGSHKIIASQKSQLRSGDGVRKSRKPWELLINRYFREVSLCAFQIDFQNYNRI
jgi:hypothetical protein